MLEVSMVWGGVVLIVALLVKHEYRASRVDLQERLDRELMALGKGLSLLEERVTIGDADAFEAAKRLEKVERQLNDVQIAKAMGRSR